MAWQDENDELRRKLAAAEALLSEKAGLDEALRESEARHRLLIGSWAQATWETNPDGVVVADSPSWRAYTGQTLEEWLGYGWVDAIHPEDRAYAERQWREAIAARGLVDAEFRLRSPDGGWRWTNVRAAPVLDAEGRIEKWAGMNIDIDARKRSEDALRKSEGRLQLALEATDLASYEWDLISDQLTTNERFRELVGTPVGEPVIGARVMEFCVHPDDRAHVDPDLARAMNSSGDGKFVFEHRLSRMGPLGHPWVLSHGQVYFGGPEDARLPVRVFGTLQEITARKKAEMALRESEERFRQFAEASLSAIWIRDAQSFAFEYVSPAVETIYGISPERLAEDERRLGALIVPEERDAIAARIRRVSQGETLIHEYRIRRQTDGAFRWIRSVGFPIRDDAGQVRRIGGIAEDVTDAKLAVEHQGVLLAELQHRVRNIMVMIRSMAHRSAGGATSVADYRNLLEGRLLALARVQTLLTRQANKGGSLKQVVESEVSAQAHASGQYALTGPDITLSPKMVEVLAFAFHELATNALKYGALSVAGGRVDVRWSVFDKEGRPWLTLDWTEEGAPLRDPPSRRGFGSELVERRIPYELKGSGKLSFSPEGLRCQLELPLNEGESILETDAPMPAVVFGGALDMTDAPDLTGRSVLVMEDDYYNAYDTAAALQGAGAEVLGPFATAAEARQALEAQRPAAAVVDLNLGGGGPKFDVARMLKEHGIPFVFLTGYDPDVIPDDMADITRLQKPIPLWNVVEAVAGL